MKKLKIYAASGLAAMVTVALVFGLVFRQPNYAEMLFGGAIAFAVAVLVNAELNRRAELKDRH